MCNECKDAYSTFLDDEYKKEVKFLDQLNLLPLLKRGTPTNELYQTVFDLYNDEYEGDDMFKAMTELDFTCYLEDRFHLEFDIHTVISKNPLEGIEYDQDTVSDVSEVG